MTDDELANLIVKELKLTHINEFADLPETEFKKVIEFLYNLKYTSHRQISRVIRISEYQLKKYLKRGV